MRYLLDTNACIRYLNGQSKRVKNRLESTRPQDIALCSIGSIVKAELFYGVEKSAKRERNMERLQRFIDQFVSLPFDDEAAVEYGQIRAQLEAIGTPIGPNDLCIAAIARVKDITLVTHNTREFSRVDGLKLEDWEVT